MPETQDATVGYMGEFHLHNGAALYELHEVTGFPVAGGGTREQVEKTHLKSPGWNREYLSTFHEDNDITVTLNSRLMSTTDLLLEAARAADDVRAFKQVMAENGVPTTQITGTCRCIGYARGEVSGNEVMQAQATFRIVTVDAIAAYAA